MKTGLRLVSPACRQGGETSWLNNFNNLAIQNDIVDVIIFIDMIGVQTLKIR